MEVIGAILASVVSIFKIQFTLYGFTLSFWQVFLFTGFGFIVAWILWRIFVDD